MDVQLTIVIITTIGAITIAVIKFVPSKNGNDLSVKHRPSQQIPLDCPEHSRVSATLKGLEEDIKEVKEDVKESMKTQATMMITLSGIHEKVKTL